jgi:hypothetical protein
LGTGKFCSFNGLPTIIKDHLSYTSRIDDPSKEADKDWFMRIDVDSLGQHKSLQLAIQQARRNVSIYKLTHLVLEDDYYRAETYISPYSYVCEFGGKIQAFGYDYGGTWFYRNKSNDRFISQLTDVVKKSEKEQSDIEKGISNALDSLGIIETGTPLHLKFLLSIFSLEGLVLSGEDKEYSLRKKLPEKIAFLIVDSSNWQETIRDLGLENFLLKSLAEARVSLVKKLEKMYDKRSDVAHSRVGNDKVLIEDFNFISRILRLVIMKLSGLNERDDERHKRITHVKKKKILLNDESSLDTYIDILKYS